MKKLYLLQVAICFAFVLLARSVAAQTFDGNVFLQGHYLEVGLNENGAFGTSVNIPSGYHGNTYDTMYNPYTSSYSVPLALGFVADPNKTGWTAYYGDFIAPVTPNEGWGISDNTGTGYAYASYYHTSGASGFSGPVTGSNTAYGFVGGLLQTVWTGKLTTDSLNIIQATIIDTGNLYVRQHITFYNSGSTTIDSFFYLRTVNPHNDYTLSGYTYTTEKIKYQLPNVGNLTVVSATGTYDTTAYMELGTKDTRAKGFLMKNDTLPPAGSFATIYWGDTATYLYGASDTLTKDVGMGLIFRIAGMGPGDTVNIDYGYSFKGGLLDTVLHIDTVEHLTLQSAMVNGGAGIAVYPNPAKDLVNISGLAAGEQVAVYDLTGRLMIQSNVGTTRALNTYSISSLVPGMYMLVVRDSGGHTLERVPLQKL